GDRAVVTDGRCRPRLEGRRLLHGHHDHRRGGRGQLAVSEPEAGRWPGDLLPSNTTPLERARRRRRYAAAGDADSFHRRAVEPRDVPGGTVTLSRLGALCRRL